MDHTQTERLREQIRREERTLEAWTLKYLSESDRASFVQDASNYEGQYPPREIWKGGKVQQPLEPTAEELAEEEAIARQLVEERKLKQQPQTVLASLAKGPPELAEPPPGYIRSSRLTHDTRTESLLNDLSPALATPGSVFVKQRFTTATDEAFKYQRAKLDQDSLKAREKYALRRTWAQQHAEKCLLLGEKPFLSGSSKATPGGK